MGEDREETEIDERRSKIRKIVIFLCLAVFLLMMFSGPLWDIDLWWHLATGRYMLETKTLPSTDPFTYTFGQYISSERNVILKEYWLAQIIFALVYKTAGLYGIIILRASILASIFLLIYLWPQKNRRNEFVIISLLILAGWFSAYSTGERPQLFSFLFALAVLFLLEHFRQENKSRKTGAWIYLFLPLTMLIWANCHGGFVLGTAILILYWAAEAFKILIKRDHPDRKQFTRLTLLILAAISISLANPNTYKAYLLAVKFQGDVIQSRTSEYLSPVAVARHGITVWPYWLYLAITILAFLFSYKRTDLTHTLIAVFLALISLGAFRYVPFFIYVTMPFTAMYLTLLVKDRHKLIAFLNKFGMPVLIAIMIFLSISGYNEKLGRSLTHPVERYRFPENAVSFMKYFHPKGNTFNRFEWGGYLIWKLFPEYKIFIDGRNLDLITFRDYTHMLWDIPEAPMLFDKYEIKTILISGLSPLTGEFYTVVNYLVRDNQWHLIYLDEMSLIFVRGAENSALIKTFSAPKTEAYNQIIAQGTLLLNSGMGGPNIRQALETAYRAKELYKNRK